MKKAALTLLMVIAMIMSCMALAETGTVVNIAAESKVYPAYHQISWIAIEYSDLVTVNGIGDYAIIDFAGSHMYRADESYYPFAQAKIDAVYTNNEPYPNEEKTSVEGKYVIIELGTTSKCVYFEDENIWKPDVAACLGTWRLKGQTKDCIRKDFSEMIIDQTHDLKSPDGATRYPAGIMPELQYEQISCPDYDQFEKIVMPASDGSGDLYFMVYAPDDYDPAKKYPLVFNVTGSGGFLSLKEVDENGIPVAFGSPVTRDAVAVTIVDYEKECIVVCPQPGSGTTSVLFSDTLQYAMDHYSIDANRIYAIASSAGGMNMSSYLKDHPSVFAAYVPCNTCWNAYDGNGKVNAYQQDPSTYLVEGERDPFGVKPVGETFEGIKNTIEHDFLPDEELCKAFQSVVDNDLPVWVFHGVNDDTISFYAGYSQYSILRYMYEQKGYTGEKLDNMIRVTPLEDEDYFSVGVPERHQASKLAVLNSDMLDWMFAQSK
ncbi:MAG: hypothetical protein ACLVB5_10475 [Christensenellales bacterium]